MAAIADPTSLADLSIPGTHESAALYEPVPGTAKAQNLTLAEQFAAGIRYVDIRCRHLDDAFQIYHGPVSELLSFDDVVGFAHDFLATHPTETIIMSIKEESAPSGNTRTFEETFDAYVAKDPGSWLVEASIPTLGVARGKIQLVRRFDATTPLGLDASAWRDDVTFTLTSANAAMRVQDQYKVTDNAAKFAAITALLAEARTPARDTLYLDYTSGYQVRSGLPDIPSVSAPINLDLDAYLADPANAHAHLGVLAMDMVAESRITAVYSTNTP
ncbi:hypothetical protein BH11MYX1_BH11MYX1_10080 [soil metagenome]